MQKSDIQKLSNALLNYETALREEEQRKREEEQRRREEEEQRRREEEIQQKQFLLKLPRNAAIFCFILAIFLGIVSNDRSRSNPSFVFFVLSLVLLSFYFLLKGGRFWANLSFIFFTSGVFLEIAPTYLQEEKFMAVGMGLASVISILVHIPMVGNKYDEETRVVSRRNIFVSGFFLLVAFAGLFGK